MSRLGIALCFAALVSVGVEARADEAAPPSSAPASAQPDAATWCAPGFEVLPGPVCHAPGPAKTGRRTLVIFLHGLTDVGSGWQHALMRGMAAAGKQHDFSLLAPMGRVGIGPGRRADQIAWPTAESARAVVEDELVASWDAARRTIEARDGKPFDEVFVMGFSNGAYYASSLALRGRLAVDGYGVFAGGSAPSGSERAARGVKQRPPVYVGIASRDDTAKKGRELAAALKRLGWPHEASARPVGHVVADAQLARAVAFLRGRVDAAVAGTRGSAAKPAASEKPRTPSKPAKRRATR